MPENGIDQDCEALIVTLRDTDERLRRLTLATMERVLAGSRDPAAMQMAYAALDGNVSASDGLDALRVALKADGLDDTSISEIENLYLNALMGV